MQKNYDNIPGELYCVPGERVSSSAENIGIKLPRIFSIKNMLIASKIIYDDFGGYKIFCYSHLMMGRIYLIN